MVSFEIKSRMVFEVSLKRPFKYQLLILMNFGFLNFLAMAGESLFLQAQRILPPLGQTKTGQLITDSKDVAMFNLETSKEGFEFKSYGPKASVVYKYDSQQHQLTLVNPKGKDEYVKAPAKTLKAWSLLELLMGRDASKLLTSFKPVLIDPATQSKGQKISKFENNEGLINLIEFRYVEAVPEPKLKSLRIVSGAEDYLFEFD